MAAEARRAAFHDRLVEQRGGRGRGEHQADVLRSGRFPGDRHMRRIAAEFGDVPLHPLQRRDLVHQRVIARRSALLGAELAVRQEAEDPEPVTDADEHDLLADVRKDDVVGAAGAIASAVDPHQHRQLAADAPDVRTSSVRQSSRPIT